MISIACEYFFLVLFSLWRGDGFGADFFFFAFERWEANEMMINVSCDALGYSGVPNPGREELDGILEAISAESKDSGLDQRFILAVMVSCWNSRPDTLCWRIGRLTFFGFDRCKSLRDVCGQSPRRRRAI